MMEYWLVNRIKGWWHYRTKLHKVMARDRQALKPIIKKEYRK